MLDIIPPGVLARIRARVMAEIQPPNPPQLTGSFGEPLPRGNCDVYWGSHGCGRPRWHDGYCRCVCADDPEWYGEGNVGGYPYYGPDTRFYGEDVQARGLPTHQEAHHE